MFQSLQKEAAYAGVNPIQFWSMSYDEIVMIIEAYNKREEDKSKMMKSVIYTTSSLIAQFINSSLCGKGIPEYEKVFKEEESIDTPELRKAKTSMLREQLIDFAIAHNKLNKGGE